MEEKGPFIRANTVVVGAGAAGLFFAAWLKEPVLILEKTDKTALKLLMSGKGSCNITNGKYLKDFTEKYGDHGKIIRGVLKKFSNKDLISYFNERNLLLEERSDGKVFPKSQSAKDVKELLLSEIRENSSEVRTNYPVKTIEKTIEGEYVLNEEILCKQLVIATGGKSYPNTGSNGEMFDVLERLGIKIIEPIPALVPLEIEKYPFSEISGVSVAKAKVKILDGTTKKKLSEKTSGLLFTDKSISGPAILDISRYGKVGDQLNIQFIDRSEDLVTKDSTKSLLNYLVEETRLPRALLSKLIQIIGIDENQKAKAVAPKTLRPFIEGFPFVISGNLGFEKAMATAGGVALEEIDMKTFELKEHKGLYIIGEACDVDGDTGGYNIQFAFSSAVAAANHIKSKN